MNLDRLLVPYQPRSSVVHQLPAGAKLGLALGVVLFTVLLPRTAWFAHAVIALALLGVFALARLDARAVLLRLALVEPLAIGIALLALTRPDGWTLFISMIVKSTSCLATMVLLTATTRFSDLLRVLWRLRVPSLLVTTLALMHRYLFVLLDEMGRMRRARRARTFVADRRSAWRASAEIAGLLFVRASERAERVYLAMCARGWRA